MSSKGNLLIFVLVTLAILVILTIPIINTIQSENQSNIPKNFDNSAQKND